MGNDIPWAGMNGNAFEPVSTIHYWSKASIGTMLEKDWAVTPRYSQLYRENELIQKTIGRELYTGPRIYINGDVEKLKKERFKVAQIGYDKNREINVLAIADKTGTIVYRYGNTTVSRLDPDGPVDEEETQEKPQNSWNPGKAIANWCNANQVPLAQFSSFREGLIAGGIVQNIPSKDLQPADFDMLIRAIEANYADMLRKPA